MSLGPQLYCVLAVPAERWDTGEGASLALLTHTVLLRLLGPPRHLLSPHPLLLSTR